MEPLLIYKALSNETRCQILSWLKNPENHFDEKAYLEQGLSFQVCVGDIQLKTGLAQSVISSYLLTMKKQVYYNLTELENGPTIAEMKNNTRVF